MTTKVVAYTSLRLGHVTRPISLRTSDRKRRERPHHPVTLSRARPPNESSVDSTIALVATCLSLAFQLLAFVSRRSACFPACAVAACHPKLTSRRHPSPVSVSEGWQDRRESNP